MMRTSNNLAHNLTQTNVIDTCFQPFPHQRAFFLKVVKPQGELKREIQSIEPRRYGKTIKYVNMQIDRALVKFFLRQDLEELRYAYASPTLKQSRRNVWDEYIRRLQHIPGFKKNEATNTITIAENNPKTGRTRLIKFYIWGLERPLDLKGGYLDGLILDENAQNPDWIFKEVFSPSLADPFHKGWCVKTGTVRGRNHVYKDHVEYMRQMKDGDPNYYAFLTRARLTKHISDEEKEVIIRQVGQDYWNQEYECMFGASGGDKYFYTQMHDCELEGRITNIYYMPERPVFPVFDIGGVASGKSRATDLTAVWFLQKNYDGSNRLIDYQAYSDMDIYTVISELRKLAYNYHTIFLPWDGESNRFVTTPAEEIRKTNLCNDVVVLPRVLKKTRIDRARSSLSNCFFDRNKCNLGIIALQEYSKTWDEMNKIFIDKPRHDVHSHGADAFTYLAMALDDIDEIIYSEYGGGGSGDIFESLPNTGY